jgi:DNA gyrase/topoisomerase IV subunit A
LYAWGKGKEIVINLDRERLPHEEKGLTLRQIDAILELQLYRLTQLSIDELMKELGEVRERIAEYESILASDKSCARSSSRNSKRFATSTATRAARRSSTRAPSCSLKT